MNSENFKFYLANHMHSSASLILNTLLDKRFYNEFNHTGIVSNKCRHDLIELSSGALRNEVWALKVFDSNGRLRSGISSGSFMNSIGNYDQCHDLMPKERLAFRTKYCLAQVDLSSKAIQLSALTGQPRSLFAPIGGRPAKIGLCLPKNCAQNDITTFTDHLLGSSLQENGLFIQTVQCDDESLGDDIVLIFALIIVVLLIAVTTTATILDLSNVKESKLSRQGRSRIGWFKNVFSICSGYKKLMAKRVVYSTRVDLKSIDGLRVISMLWIIVIHSYNFGFQWLSFDNLNTVDNVYREASIQWIANGTFSVDNFFLISGFLAWFKCLYMFGFLKDELRPVKRLDCGRRRASNCSSSEDSNEMDSGGDNSSIDKWFLIRKLSSNIYARYLRLVPTMMFLILISVSLLPRIAWAPNWSNATIMFDEWCHFNWYINFLLLQNFINTPNMCFSHSWYLAVDFQLFIMVNVILSMICYHLKSINLVKTIFYAKWSLISIIIIAQSSIATLIYHYNLPSAPLVPVDSLESMLDYYGLVYIKPYYWLTSYSIGSLLAICIISVTSKEVTMKKRRKDSSISGGKSKIELGRIKKFITIVQIVAPCILIGLILSIWPYFQGTHKMIGMLSCLHALFVRPLWSLSLASILFIILQTKSKFISRNNVVYKMIHSFLSLKVWSPLSRLTYSAYLFHPLVMAIFYGSRKETFRFSHPLILYFCIGNIVLTYFGSLFIYLTIELPIERAIEQMTLSFLIYFRNNNNPKPNLSSTGTQKRSDFLSLSLRRPR